MSRKIEPNKDGLKLRVTSGSLTVAALHYAADENKNPANPVGKAWLVSALSGYGQGLQDPRWLKEMELMYSAALGQKVFPDFSKWLRASNIFVEGDIDLTNAKLYGSYDHGYASPACYLVNGIWPGNLKRTLWEFYAPNVEVPFISKLINGESVTLRDGRKFEGNPYAGREIFKIADPEIFRATQVMTKGPNKSVSWMFAQNRVHFQPGMRGDDGTVAGWLTGNLWVDPMNPDYQIHRRCKNLIWELSMLQRQTLSSHTSKFKNQPETLVDKDNHAWDALKYWLKRFPVGMRISEEPEKEADFKFWMDIAKKPNLKSSYVRRF